MDSPCIEIQIRVDLSSSEQAQLENDLRSKFGPFVVHPERAEELKKILDLADKDIEDHDSEVARLQNQILLVRAQKQRLETQRDKLRSLLSPIRKLPAEILLGIFQIVCAENVLQTYPWLSDRRPPTKITSPVITYLPAMAISSVCFRWRELALSLPSLWANLSVEICTAMNLNPVATEDGFNDTVARYLERSDDWPLRLALYIQGASPATVLPSLTRHAHRWKTFKYQGYYSLTVDQILSQLRFPLLVELDISSFMHKVESSYLDCFEHSSQLHALGTDKTPASKFNYSQLDTLNFAMEYASELVEALRSCPSLKFLRIEPICREFLDLEAQGTWRNIVSLVIMENYMQPSSEMVLSSFDFPSLNEFVVEGYHRKRTTWPADAFISFVSRSSCLITTFTLRGISLSDAELITALSVMPSLLHLEIDDKERRNSYHVTQEQQSPITSHLISNLRSYSRSLSLAPKLHSLSLISHLNTGTFDDNAFIRMVQSRWFKPHSDLSTAMSVMGKRCIRSVILRFAWREIDADVYKPLRKLDEEGLRVVVAGTNGIQMIVSLCAECAKPLQIRVNLTSEELAELDNDLRSEFGPFVVTPEQAEDLEKILALADKDIEEHDLEVNRLNEQIMFLQKHKQRLEIQRAKLRSLLSPMRKLPNETLLRVFQFVCQENLLQSYPWLDQCPPTTITSPIITYLPTMAVSSVCSRWRELALSSPSLWANLRMEIYPTAFEETLAGLIDTLKRYLERSGDWPLRLDLNIQGQGRELPSLIHLAQNAYRWRTFIFSGVHSFTTYEILSQMRFPVLEELDLNSTSEWVQLSDFECFEHSTRLCSLATDAFPPFKAPYNQLDKLIFRMGQASPSDLAMVVHTCSSVKSLIVELDNEEFWGPMAEGTFHNITSLVFKEHFQQSCSEMVFYSFAFPSLNELEIDSERSTTNKPTIWPGNAFISFVSSSSCLITTFTLRGLSLSDLELIAALRVMPSLLHLEIDDAEVDHSLGQQNPITSQLVSSLHHNSTSNLLNLCSKLHSLRLISRNQAPFDDCAFVSMIQSRWFRPGSESSYLSAAILTMGRGCIRSVVLKFAWREIDAEAYKPLRILDEEGLRVVVAGTNGIQV